MTNKQALTVDCVLFDLDGTLINTAPDFLETARNICDQKGITAPHPELIVQNVSNGAGAIIDLLLSPCYPEFDKDFLLKIFLERYLTNIANTTSRLYPSYNRLLDSLEKQKIPWGIVTNKPSLYSEALLDALNLRSRCSVLVCPEDVVEKKPSAEPINLALKTLGCSSDRSVYVGDHVRDIQSAKNANVIAIAAAYGYIPNGIKIEEWGADFILDSSTNLSNLLKTLRFS
jgi:phosphoglycolate phosphatase